MLIVYLTRVGTSLAWDTVWMRLTCSLPLAGADPVKARVLSYHQRGFREARKSKGYAPPTETTLSVKQPCAETCLHPEARGPRRPAPGFARASQFRVKRFEAVILHLLSPLRSHDHVGLRGRVRAQAPGVGVQKGTASHQGWSRSGCSHWLPPGLNDAAVVKSYMAAGSGAGGRPKRTAQSSTCYKAYPGGAGCREHNRMPRLSMDSPPEAKITPQMKRLHGNQAQLTWEVLEPAYIFCSEHLYTKKSVIWCRGKGQRLGHQAVQGLKPHPTTYQC